MNEAEISKLIDMNNRLNLILGYTMGWMWRNIPESSTINPQYEWIVKAIENACYLDQPLPPMP